MKLYRACLRRFEVGHPGGALVVEGRWHALGMPVLYCAESLALAVLEQNVNGNSIRQIRDAFHFSEVETGSLVAETAPESLYAPAWRSKEWTTRGYGMEWFREQRTPILRVRSAALSEEWNCILNTAHPDFRGVRFSKARNIPLDARF